MKALYTTVPEAYEDIWSNVYPNFSVVGVEKLSQRYSSDCLKGEYSDLKDFVTSLLDWQEKWKLLDIEGKDYANLLIADYVSYLCYSWLSMPERAADLSPFPIYSYTIGKMKIVERAPSRPPTVGAFETKKEYMSRAEKYAEREIAARFGATLEESIARGAFEVKSDSRKPRLWKEKFYNWAACYQCKPGTTLNSCVEEARVSEDEFRKHVQRVLKICQILPRDNLAGPKRKTG